MLSVPELILAGHRRRHRHHYRRQLAISLFSARLLSQPSPVLPPLRPPRVPARFSVIQKWLELRDVAIYGTYNLRTALGRKSLLCDLRPRDRY